MKLNLKQTQALDYLEDKETTEILFGGAAGGGKSILGNYFLTKFSLKYPESRWIMGRSSMKTLKETTYISFLKMAKIQGLSVNRDFEITSAHHKEYPNSIIFPNESVILMKDLGFYPSDPDFDELGSLEITGAFIDEANQVTAKAKNVVASRMRHNITKYKILPKLLMTCNPSKGFLYNDFYKPSKNGTILPYRRFIQSFVTDNPDIDGSYIENLKKLDEASKQRLLYGNWEYDDDPATLIEYDKILDCFTADYVPTGDKYMTIDVARFGKDTSVICIWDGLRCIAIYQYYGKSVTEVADVVRAMQTQFNIPNSQTIADEDGVGGGVVDILKCKGFVNNSMPLPSPDAPTINGERPKENFTNLKSQCYFKLAELINNGAIYINCKDATMKEAIVQEMEQVKQYNMDKDGKKQIVPKDKVKEVIGRSPDFSDALMMRMWFHFKPKRQYIG